MACIVPTPCMADEMGTLTLESLGGQTLQSLAKQLQYYKPPSLNEEVENSDQDIASNLGIADSVAVNNDPFSCVSRKVKRAAVLICLFEGHEGELRVILTKRSMKLSSYPGQVALPGGKMEEGDADDSATALRETMEEIGLDPGLVKVVANLQPFLSEHLLRVVPVVGLLSRREDFKPALNTDEVDDIFDVPLEMFLEEDNHRYGEREWMGWKYILHLFDYESEQGGFLIWGLTAGILIRAASVVYQRIPSFTHHLPDFQQLQRALHGPIP
ncbi:hypothetical protein L1049_008901 [Liquidambar formosana]|uniref:Nudix hydrolase domain-containing protein n=1 Tax=Liquidambar formosana TaxID=63359 RepID=A0AAP0S507_LIQFO